MPVRGTIVFGRTAGSANDGGGGRRTRLWWVAFWLEICGVFTPGCIVRLNRPGPNLPLSRSNAIDSQNCRRSWSQQEAEMSSPEISSRSTRSVTDTCCS